MFTLCENDSSQWRWNSSSCGWNLFSRWYDGLCEISNLGDASWKIPRLHGISKLESQLQGRSMCKNSESSNYNALDHRGWESTVNWRIEHIPIDSRETRLPGLRNAGRTDSVFIEEASQPACSLPRKSECRRAACSKHDRFWRRRQIAHMTHEYFRATGAYESVQGLSDLFTIRLQNDDVQDFDVRWDQALLSADETLAQTVLGGLHKSKFQDSVQLQTLLALYDQETVRNNGQQVVQDWKTSVRAKIWSKMRSRNLKAQNEVIHGGILKRSRRGNRANIERKVGDCWQWQATGHGFKGDSCGFNHGIKTSGNGSVIQKQERSSSPAPNSKATWDGKGKSTSSDKKNEGSVDKRNKIPCQWRNCTNPSCSYKHSPVCQSCISEAGCRYGRNCYFRHVELEEKPNKKSKKGGAKGSVAMLKELA